MKAHNPLGIAAEPIADAHNDLLTELAIRAGDRNPFRDRWLRQLQRGGVRLQVCAVFSADRPSAALARRDALAQIDAFERAVVTNVDAVQRVRRRGDLTGDGRVALVLALEGAEALGGKADGVDELWDRGIRIVAPVWNRRNAFGGGSDTWGLGLTPHGERLVDRVVQLGGVVDLAHASPETFADVLARVPDGRVFVSHSACRDVFDHPRNLTDPQLAALAARRGIFAVLADATFIDPERPTVERVVDHIQHAVEVIGIERVALGGDFLDQIARSGALHRPRWRNFASRLRRPRFVIGGFRGPEAYPRLVEALCRRGFNDDARRRILHDNLAELLAAALPN